MRAMERRIIALVSVAGLMSCGNSSVPLEKSVASKPVAPSAAPTEELWRYAPDDTEFGVVAANGVLADLYAQGSIMLDDASAVPAIETSVVSVRQSLRGFLATIGLPDNTRFAEMGIDIRLGAAFFSGESGDVLVLPVSDRKRFVLAMGGTVGAETDSLGAGRVCKILDSHYVCGSSTAQLAALAKGTGLSEEIASWPVSHRGQLEAFVSPSKFSGESFSKVMSNVGGVRVAAKVGKGEVEVRAHLVGTPVGVLAEVVGASSAIFDDLRTIPSSGALLLGFSRVWSKYRADLMGMAPNVDVIPGVNPHALLQSIDGDMLALAAPGKFASIAFSLGLRDERAFVRMLEECNTLGDSIPQLQFSLESGRCTAALDVFGARYQIELQVKAKRFIASVEGPAIAFTGTPSDEVHPVATRLADENWNVAGWGFGTMDIVLQNIVASVELDTGSIPPDAAAGLWAAAHFNEIGFGGRVAEDGAHTWFKLRTAWSNSDAVMSELRPALRALAHNDTSAVQSLATIREKYPESRWAKDTRDGGGGIVITASVGILAAVAVPAFMKYMKRARASEALTSLKRLQQSARALAAEGKLPPSAPRTPPISADCTHEGKREKFAVNAAYWEHPTWKALGFSQSEEHHYAYEFVNHGDWYQIFAYGDLDCDGDYSKYTIGHNGIRGPQLDSDVVVENGLE